MLTKFKIRITKISIAVEVVMLPLCLFNTFLNSSGGKYWWASAFVALYLFYLASLVIDIKRLRKLRAEQFEEHFDAIFASR